MYKILCLAIPHSFHILSFTTQGVLSNLQSFQDNEQQLRLWMNYRDKHKEIIGGLQTLALDLSMNCIVPLGRRALMKGKLNHTNEILVCIGDEYFSKYSTPQAVALCNRRMKRKIL